MINDELVRKSIESYLLPQLYNKAVSQLILGTIAVESDFGRYRTQINPNYDGAKGITQIERPTFKYLKEKYVKRYPLIEQIEWNDLAYNDLYAIVFCRLKYLSVNSKLPKENDIEAMAAYHKIFYNSVDGATKVTDFIKKYNKYCKE
jgi:hypothetical protein